MKPSLQTRIDRTMKLILRTPLSSRRRKKLLEKWLVLHRAQQLKGEAA